ncbi:MAG: hypothetical protein IKK75_06955 [Clostridia bacterium]|nr:hypothetical protein [Clostridia bacterium]
MKKLICMVLVLLTIAGSACATIIEPRGVDMEFRMFSGIEARRAVVLCKSLSVHANPTASSRKVRSLTAGNTFLTWATENEWRNCYYSDGAEAAWVRDYYVIVDPAYYRTDDLTPVYAYGDVRAPRIGLLDDGEELPIIMETADWCVISLRGAAGWVYKSSNDLVRTSWFQPEMLLTIKRAELSWTNGYASISDPYQLAQISALLTDVHPMGGPVSSCPFGMYLTLTLENDERVVLELATDGCCIYRVSGRDYRYGYLSHAVDSQLLRMFPGYR